MRKRTFFFPSCLRNLLGRKITKATRWARLISLLLDQNTSRENRYGYRPISIIINSPSSWVRNFSLQLKKEKSQAANFFHQQLDVMFVISYWLMYKFFKFYLLLDTVISLTKLFSKSSKLMKISSQMGTKPWMDQGTSTRCSLIALTTSAALPLKMTNQAW